MAAKPKSREPLPRKPRSVSDAEEKIRLRAYELYEEHGKIEGHALDDWLQAEEEIFGRRGQPKNVRPRKPK
jgi:Protein of unknown function (DUF2934)